MGQSRRAADSGFVGVLVWSNKQKWWEMDKKLPRNICFEEVEEPETAVMYSHIATRSSVRRGTTFFVEAKAPNTTCFHHWATDVVIWHVRENWPSTSAFFFLPSRQLLRFDFNALCSFVFSCKILLYLNVFILLNVLISFGYYTLELLYYTHVAVTNFFLWKRPEENTKQFSPAMLTHLHLQYRKTDAQVSSQDLLPSLE